MDYGVWEEVSDDAKDLITQLLQKDPKDRIKLKDAMNHAWLKV